MPRYRLTLEYDGTGLVGWQRQDNGPSVQQALADAFRAFCGEDLIVHAAGRTDAGVHALGQVAHVDLSRDWPDDTVRKAVNQHLRPHPIVILDAVRAPDDFHARHDALERSYLYRIANRKAPLALERNRAWYISYPLDVAAMHEAAQVLVGHHDFSTFRDSGCQAKSPLKTLDAISVERHGTTIEIKTSARSFLHRQVRSMVGSLYYVGDGKWSAGGLKDALEARDRKACGVIAPACGLYLETVEYPA